MPSPGSTRRRVAPREIFGRAALGLPCHLLPDPAPCAAHVGRSAVDGTRVALAPATLGAIMRANRLSNVRDCQPGPRRTRAANYSQRTRKNAGKRKAKAVLDRPPAARLADQRRRRDRAAALARPDRNHVRSALEPEHPYFGTFRTRSASGGSYEVEIRSLRASPIPAVASIIRVNGLGTCKHIEGVLAALARRRARRFRAAAAAGSPARRDVPRSPAPARRPSRGRGTQLAGSAGCRSADGCALISRPTARCAPIRSGSRRCSPPGDGARPVSPRAARLAPFRAVARPAAARASARRRRAPHSRPMSRAGRATLDIVCASPAALSARRHAASRLRRARAAGRRDGARQDRSRRSPPASCWPGASGIERVLVVCPASLKAEWEEQIARFTDRADPARCSAREPQRLARLS